MGDPTYERYCAGVEAETAGFVAAVTGADPAAPVPTCPGWTIADLVRHHGRTLRWVEHLVRTQATEYVSSRDLPLGLPEGASAYPAWFAGTAAALVRALRTADPDAAVWTFGGTGRVRFWARRLFFEAVIHHADATIALGGTPRVDAGTAADGIEEILDLVAAQPRFADRFGELDRVGDTLHLHATDADGEWTIRLGVGGFTWERGHAKGTVAVRASAADLFLFAYGRIKPGDERLTVFGDADLLAAWLAATAV